jgi:SAM-dependent methyltransferase
MAFVVSADAYVRFMGRYSQPLAQVFADLVDVAPPQRALDVGAGTGALTAVLVERLGAASVHAVDPSAPFVEAMQERFPGVDVRLGGGESLPYEDGAFDRVLAQLVVQFMSDPVGGLTEMARVAAPGGIVAANLWDHAAGRGPLGLFWQAAADVTPGVVDESGQPGVKDGQLQALFEAAGMTGPVQTVQSVTVQHPTFDDWWGPFTLGVGPAGDHVARLSEADREALRERCRQLQPPEPFSVQAHAWTVTWAKPGA